MLGVGGIDHLDALESGSTVRSIVGAVTAVRRSILGICSLKLSLGLLAHEFQIAVVGALGIAAETFFHRRLALESAFRLIPRTTIGFGHRSRKRVGESDRSAAQRTPHANGCNRNCPH